ncbi:MAG: DUF167 domain-containing protein [Candidatus Azambacteria bacterium]|nr:DUF167 domain-containing protein [Candidatus Azambacteria bacterium]
MKIFVNVKPGAKKEKIVKIDETHYAVSVKAPPADGKANIAIKRALAEYFDVNVSSVSILSGQTSRRKIIEIS